MSDFWGGGDDGGGLPAGRKWAVVVCCRNPDCLSTDVSRDTSTGAVAYWSCKRCACSWKESLGVGRGHARIAESG